MTFLFQGSIKRYPAVRAWHGHVRHGDTWNLRRALFRQYAFSRAAAKT